MRISDWRSDVCSSDLDLGAFTGVQGELGLVENELGIGNRLSLLDDEIVTNLKDIQLRNGLPPSSALASGDFTVEMETGTGKTYVYLRTVRSEEHTSELQSLMRISYAVFCLKKKKKNKQK